MQDGPDALATIRSLLAADGHIAGLEIKERVLSARKPPGLQHLPHGPPKRIRDRSVYSGGHLVFGLLGRGLLFDLRPLHDERVPPGKEGCDPFEIALLGEEYLIVVSRSRLLGT